MKQIPKLSICIFLMIFALGYTLFSQPDTLTIIHVNDSHSNLLPYASGDAGGMARAASIIGQWSLTEPNPILLHAGDFMVGTLMFNAYFGIPELLLLESLGFDAVVLGNHEFDAGPVDLGNILETAQLDSSFNIICSNALNCQAVPKLDSIVRPYAIEQRGNIKIGIIGLTTPSTNVTSNPSPVVIDENFIQSTIQTIDTLQTEGCQVILVLSHLGFTYDVLLAANISGVDAIIGGHTHTILENVVYINNIPIVQAGEFYHFVGKLTLIYNGIGTTVDDYRLQLISTGIPAEPTVDMTVQTLKSGIIAQYTPVIGDPYQNISYTPDTLFAYPQNFDTLDSPMGNLVTTAMLDYVDTADCAMEPNGHIVEELYPGNVNSADLFRCYPYGYDASDGLGFRLTSYELLGTDIIDVLQQLLNTIDPANEDWDFLPQSAGLHFSAYNSPQGVQLETITIDGVPVNPTASYKIVSSDQVVNYLVGLFGLTPQNQTIYPISVFQVVKEYVETIDTLDFAPTGSNLVGIKHYQNAIVSDQYLLKQNYPNPFNPTTIIEFYLPRTSEVSLKIFNILGEEVTTLVSNRLTAGSYSYEWDASNLASGVYLYRLQAGDPSQSAGKSYVETMKMVLMR